MKSVLKKLIVPVVALGISLALWSCTTKENTKIIFDSNDGSHVAESTKKVEAEPIPTKNGFIFEGWFTSNDFKDERVTFPLELGKENITLYAKWSLENYTITYHLDGGTNHSSNPNNYTIEDSIVLEKPTKENKEFVGWYRDAEFKTEVSSITKGTTGNLELYAKWVDKSVQESYTISYHLDGGVNASTNPTSYIKGTKVVLKDASKKGYAFAGWYEEENFVTRVTEFSEDSTGNKNVYAKFTIEEYTITYHLDGGNNHKNNPSTYTVTYSGSLLDPNKNDMEFVGWYTDAKFESPITEIVTGTTGNLDLYAKWSKKSSYHVIYHLDGGNNHKNNLESYEPGKTLVLKEAEKLGYRFMGWYLEDSFLTKVTQIDADAIGDKNLYAKFEVIQYAITYHLDGGTNAVENPEVYTVLDAFSFKKPAREHMVFKGWYTDAAFKNEISAVEFGTTGDLELYVKWEHVDYTITYHLDGGINDQANPAGYTTGTIVTFKPATKLGYHFEGWYTDDTYASKITEISADASGNKEIYAKFSLEQYAITYELNGGVNGENPTTYTIEDQVILVAAEKPGYHFEGWYTDAELECPVEGIATGSTGAKVFYAKYTINYEVMYGIWSKDGFYAFVELTQTSLLYNGISYTYTMDEFTSSKIKVGTANRGDVISFSYNPKEETLTFVREYFKNEDATDRTKETSTLSQIILPDTKAIAGVYYTGDNRSVKDLVIDNYGHLTRFNGSDTYQGTVTFEHNLLTLVFKTNNLGDPITYTGTLVDGVITLIQKDVVSIYVKADEPKVYYSDNNIAVYQYKNFCVVEKEGNDYLATVKGEFKVDELITLTFNDEDVKFKVKSLAGSSWGSLEAGKAFAGEYLVFGTEDKLVLDGFGPTNGTLGKAEYNDQEVQYSITKYLTHILLIFADETEKYYLVEDKTLTEITELDGLQGNYSNGSTTYRISGLGYAIRMNNSYFEVYTYNQQEQTITINNMVFHIYHNGNVLLRSNTAYVKEGYVVESKDFTSYLDKIYQNEDNAIKLKVSKTIEDDKETYYVTVVEAFTIHDVVFDATTYDAVYVLDRMVFNGVELIVSDSLALVVDTEHTYSLTEFVPAQSFAEQLVGLYVYNTSYYVNIFNEEGALKVYYSSSINAYSTPTAYEVTIEDEANLRAQYKYSSYTFAFTFAERDGVKSITFDNETYVDYSYRGKTFTAYDDSTVELVSKNYESKAGSNFSASSLAVIKENGIVKNWNNISFVTPLTAEQKNVPGVYEVEVYAWVYGKKLTTMVSYTVVEDFTLSYSKKSIFVKEGFGKAEIIALGMFTAKHNGVIDVITEDMITLPDDFDSMIPGSYDITCTYHGQTQTAELTINSDPTGHYSYISGETNTSYGTYFSSGFDVELINEKISIKIGSTTLTNVVSGNEYVINNKDITIKLLANGQITFTYTDSRWNPYTTTYAKPKEVDMTKYEGVYLNGSYYVRLFAEDKILKVYYGSSINPYSDPTSYECLLLDEEAGSLQFTYSSYINAFTFNEVGTKSITFGSETTVEYSYRGKTFTYYDDSTVELVGKNYSSKAGTSPSASTLAEIKENSTSKNWTNIKFVTALTTEQKNEVGPHTVEVYAWVYGKKLVANISFTVIENYSLSRSNKNIYTQSGYGKADIIASGMFTAKHNGVADTITEDMITLPEGFDSTVAGTYTITCTYYTETLTATLTIMEEIDYEGIWTTSNTETYVKEDLTFVKNADGTFNITYGSSTTWKNITLPAVGKYVYLDTYEYYYLTINANDITLTYERGSTYQYSTYKKQV